MQKMINEAFNNYFKQILESEEVEIEDEDDLEKEDIKIKNYTHVDTVNLEATWESTPKNEMLDELKKKFNDKKISCEIEPKDEGIKVTLSNYISNNDNNALVVKLLRDFGLRNIKKVK